MTNLTERKCDYCKDPASQSFELPLSGSNPYPEYIYTCDKPACVNLAEGEVSEAEHYAEESAPGTPCNMCHGNDEKGYDCPMAHLYPPGECRYITGVW